MAGGYEWMGNDMFLVHKRQLAADLNEPHIAMTSL